MVDPRKEGSRLAAPQADEGFLIFLGLGGGFQVEAALERQEVQQALAVEYGIHGAAELLASRDYTGLFGDPRFHLLVDPPEDVLARFILDAYRPALFGGVRLIPLRTRTSHDQERFSRAAGAVKAALDQLAADYSVQAHFGQRWFANMIRNLFQAERLGGSLPPIRHAAVCAAGPSLDAQLSLIAERRSSLYLIAADTALPALLHAGLAPDAAVSIDCQHISYYHFMEGIPPGIPLFLDLASPPLLAGRCGNPRFFAGGHPLARYISRYWRPFPEVDTSGANVTYAALSVAERLGAERVELYGADFSYPLGRTYARGTYLYPYFEARQNRLKPLEAHHSAFLYRTSPLEKVQGTGGLWYYETPSLRGYRERLEAKARLPGPEIRAAPGMGAPLVLVRPQPRPEARPLRLFAAGRARMSAEEFLSAYRRDIAALPLPEGHLARYMAGLDAGAGGVLTTLLPLAAALKRRGNCTDGRGVIKAAREYALGGLDEVMGRAAITGSL
jgi:hypothetical protein